MVHMEYEDGVFAGLVRGSIVALRIRTSCAGRCGFPEQYAMAIQSRGEGQRQS